MAREFLLKRDNEIALQRPLRLPNEQRMPLGEALDSLQGTVLLDLSLAAPHRPVHQGLPGLEAIQVHIRLFGQKGHGRLGRR